MDVAHAGFAGGHSGKNRTVDRLELAYWWPGIHYDVETFISKCVRCQELSGRKPQPSSLQSLTICEEPNFRVHMSGIQFRPREHALGGPCHSGISGVGRLDGV